MSIKLNKSNITLTGGSHLHCVALQNEALSASGTSIQGCHIVHPAHPGETGGNFIHQPEHHLSRIWAQSQSAALADAWSTALMLMAPEEIRRAPSDESMLNAVHIEEENGFDCICA